MQLSDAASAMYKTWWAFASYAASATSEDGSYAFTVTDASAAASDINKNVYGGQGGYNPIGLSQLFSIARRMSNTSIALSNAPDDSPITEAMVAPAPWGRPDAEQAASPQWWARGQMTYTTPDGTTETGTFMIQISQTLPYSVGALNTYVSIMAQSQLADTSPTGTPRQGELQSIDSIQLLSWLGVRGRRSALPAAGRKDPHPRSSHIRGHRNPARGAERDRDTPYPLLGRAKGPAARPETPGADGHPDRADK